MCSNLDENIICSNNYLPRNNISRLVIRWDGDCKWTYRTVMWTLDGVVEPKVTPTMGVAGSAPYNFLHFLAVHHGARTCGRKEKESRISSRVYQLTRGIIFSYFQYLERAVREK